MSYVVGRVPKHAVKAVRFAFFHVYHLTLSVNMRNDAYHLVVFNALKVVGIIASHKAVAVFYPHASVQNVRAVGTDIKHYILLFDPVLDRRQHNVRPTLVKKRLHRASDGKEGHASAVT